MLSTEIHQNKKIRTTQEMKGLFPRVDVTFALEDPNLPSPLHMLLNKNENSINSTHKLNISGWRSLHEDSRSSSLTSVQIFLRWGTFVLSSCASPVQALASRKSPLRTAILFPNCMSFSGPSESVNSFRLTIPRCTRKAVWINSVISAKFLWLWHKKKIAQVVFFCWHF